MMNLNRNLVQALLLLTTLVLSQSCSDDDKAIDTVFQETERGAVLRTIERDNENFIDGDLTSTFSILIEEQSIETDNQFENVLIFVKYIDRDPSGLGMQTAETLLRAIPPDEFFTGPVQLPRLALNIEYQEVIEALNLDINTIEPGDQFELRMELVLNDGRSFSNDSASAVILTDFCSFKSPYRYVINVLEPLASTNFTGVYTYSLLTEDSAVFNLLGIPQQGITSFTSIAQTNVRRGGIFEEGLEFAIAGPFIYPKIYQTIVTSGVPCSVSQGIFLSNSAESSFGIYTDTDDTVFELDIIFASEKNFREQVRIRFTKQ